MKKIANLTIGWQQNTLREALDILYHCITFPGHKADEIHVQFATVDQVLRDNADNIATEFEGHNVKFRCEVLREQIDHPVWQPNCAVKFEQKPKNDGDIIFRLYKSK